MADISKCSAINEQDQACPLRESCWRYLTPENDKWQSWIAAPFKIYKFNAEEDTYCDSYWQYPTPDFSFDKQKKNS